MQVEILDTEKRAEFLFGGKCTFTLKSKKTGKHYTYRVTNSKTRPSYWHVNLLTGPDNRYSYTTIGWMHNDNRYLFHKKPYAVRNGGLNGIEWFLTHLNSNQVEMYHEGKCCRCNRKLTTPDSIKRGMGPECIKYANVRSKGRR